MSSAIDNDFTPSKRRTAQSLALSHMEPPGLPMNHDELPPNPHDKWNKHYHLPVVISGYIRLVFNIFCLICLIAALVVFFFALRGDITLRTARSMESLLQEIAQCEKDFVESNCATIKSGGAALSALCHQWQLCMNRDPSKIEITSISVKAVAEAVNSFVEPITYKTMVFVALLFFIILIGSNCILGFQRKVVPGDVQHYGPQSMAITPYRGSTPWAR
ncbi:hypothetical protein P9112_003261 [Eukaryota sp. TZLM1-RC]